jgi:hypothetical protein
LDTFKECYSKLYTEECIDQEVVKEFLENIPKLPNNISEKCEGEINKEEILAALHS